ncbi:MAG: hypothetical protein DRP13_04410 [Candidatus Aenigmatarchaeota archaeon]|nr:MAG: hypothetical protein DRP13_04410 [Candidatus Aenigmarchaeota archaeon]
MEEIIRFLNHWWREGKVRKNLALEFKRESFFRARDLLKKRQILVIHGLRRVGKSTLIYQLIQYLIRKRTNPKKILYFSFDKKTSEIKNILDIYSEITEIDYERESVFVFLDEVYKLEGWHKELKLLYDALPNIKFVVSGSASLKIEKEARSALAGRVFYLEMKPLSFKEFFELKFGKKPENIKTWENKLRRVFPSFVRKPFPEIVNFSEEEVMEYINEMVIDKLIFSDFSKTFENINPGLLQNLTELFFSNPGMYLNIESLSKSLRKSKNDLLFHIKLLEMGYIISIVKNYRGSYISGSRKMRRVYPYHPALIQGLFKEIDESKLIECFVRSLLDAKFYWRENGKEVDFVVDGKPVEVKYKNSISNADLKNLLQFMEKFCVKKGYIISKNVFKNIKENKKQISVIPAWYLAVRGWENEILH